MSTDPNSSLEVSVMDSVGAYFDVSFDPGAVLIVTWDVRDGTEVRIFCYKLSLSEHHYLHHKLFSL